MNHSSPNGCLQVLAELKELLEYRRKYFAAEEDPRILALGLSSRKNLCIHPRVSGERAVTWGKRCTGWSRHAHLHVLTHALSLKLCGPRLCRVSIVRKHLYCSA